MSRFRLVVVGLMSVLVLMGVAASSASAEVKFELLPTEECINGTWINFCYIEKEGEVLKELSGEEEFSALLDNGPSTLTSGSLNLQIVCSVGENVLTTSRIAQPNPLKEDYRISLLELLFSSCTTSGVKCTVKEPIEVTETEGTPENLEAKLSETWLHFKPEAAKKEVFATITLEGTECPETVSGKNPVKGEQWCEWLEILVDSAAHLLECPPSESKLVFGKNEATFGAEFEVEPDNLKDLWDIEEA
jgi:hypothetical protein